MTTTPSTLAEINDAIVRDERSSRGIGFTSLSARRPNGTW